MGPAMPFTTRRKTLRLPSVSVVPKVWRDSDRNPAVSAVRNAPKVTRAATGNDRNVAQKIASMERNAICTQSTPATRRKLAWYVPAT